MNPQSLLTAILSGTWSQVVVIGSGPSASLASPPAGSLIITANQAYRQFPAHIHVSVDPAEMASLHDARMHHTAMMIGRHQLAKIWPERVRHARLDFPGSGVEALELGNWISQSFRIPMHSYGLDFGVFMVSGNMHHYASWHAQPRKRVLIRGAEHADPAVDAFYPCGFHRQTQVLRSHPIAKHHCYSAIDTNLLKTDVNGVTHAINPENVARVIEHLRALSVGGMDSEASVTTKSIP